MVNSEIKAIYDKIEKYLKKYNSDTGKVEGNFIMSGQLFSKKFTSYCIDSEKKKWIQVSDLDNEYCFFMNWTDDGVDVAIMLKPTSFFYQMTNNKSGDKMLRVIDEYFLMDELKDVAKRISNLNKNPLTKLLEKVINDVTDN